MELTLKLMQHNTTKPIAMFEPHATLKSDANTTCIMVWE